MGCGKRRITDCNYGLCVNTQLHLTEKNNDDPSSLIDFGFFKYGQYETDRYEDFNSVSKCNCVNSDKKIENRKNRDKYKIIFLIIVILIVFYFMRK